MPRSTRTWERPRMRFPRSRSREVRPSGSTRATVASQHTGPGRLCRRRPPLNRQAQQVELDEATTRILIDDQLRAAGWIVDSRSLRHAIGTRPQLGQAVAIAEWPTESGPVDYALFIDGRCVGVIEASVA